MNASNEIVIKMNNITKQFGPIKALNNVNFELKKGEIHALLGENGAGKSTFLNILSGVYPQDGGEIILDGECVTFKNPLAAKNKGIIKVHQELQLIPELTVAQNMFLGHEILNRYGMLDYKKMEIKANEMLDKLRAGFKGNVITKKLSIARQQTVEIAKALLYDFNVLALDEPTSSLTAKEINELFTIVRALKEQGKSIIFISHRIDEIFGFCDRATVLRDGIYIDTVDISEIDKSGLVKMMTGSGVGTDTFHSNKPISNDIILECKKLFSQTNRFKDINFSLHKGEILGLAGLVGSGRTELVRAIFGADKLKSGQIYVKGKAKKISKPQDAIKQGIMLIPEDRKLQGFAPNLSNVGNVALISLDKYKRLGFLNFSEMADKVKVITDGLHIRPNNNNLKTKRLSGGNQQKVVVAKAINVEPDILILDEPTRGIDVNTKREIYELIRKLADYGKSIILISSELPEILKLSDRILVMYEGRIKGELNGLTATENQVMNFATGG